MPISPGEIRRISPSAYTPRAGAARRTGDCLFVPRSTTGRNVSPRCPPTTAARRTNRRVRLLWTSTGMATIPPSTVGGTGPTSTRRCRTPRSAVTPPTRSSATRKATRKKSHPAIRLVASRKRNPLRARAASPSGVGTRNLSFAALMESTHHLTIFPPRHDSDLEHPINRVARYQGSFDWLFGAAYTGPAFYDRRFGVARGKLVLTYQHYLQMPDDRNRREILSGDLYVTPAPTPIHQRAVVNLITLLQGYLARHKVGKLYASPVDVVLSQVDVVQPDLVFVSNDRLHLVTEMSIQGAPDLVVEILSPSTARLDRGRKMDAYARFGVREYWIADTDARTLEIYRLEGQNRRLTSTSEATALSSAVFPDLTFDLQSLWD